MTNILSGILSECKVCSSETECLEERWAITFDNDGVTCDKFSTEHAGRGCHNCAESNLHHLSAYGVWRCNQHGVKHIGSVPNLYCEEWRKKYGETMEARYRSA
jgi:hypothetical protein